MGNGGCNGPRSTAKLILLDGQLKEFPSPVKVSNLALKSQGSFVCNSEEMNFDEIASAVSGDEELQPGHLYFELPSAWLTRPLRAEDMAALASKASAAHMIRSRDNDDDDDQVMECGCYTMTKRVDPLIFFSDVPTPDMVVESGGATADQLYCLVDLKRRKRGGGGGGASAKFSRNLSDILEVEDE